MSCRLANRVVHLCLKDSLRALELVVISFHPKGHCKRLLARRMDRAIDDVIDKEAAVDIDKRRN